MNNNMKNVVTLLKTAKGQIEGIVSMIEKERQCLDISAQIHSTISILKKVNAVVISKNIDCCISDVIEKGTEESKLEQLKKINQLLSKIS